MDGWFSFNRPSLADVKDTSILRPVDLCGTVDPSSLPRPTEQSVLLASTFLTYSIENCSDRKENLI